MVVLQHVHRAHGYSGWEARSLAGLDKKVSVTQPEFHERASARATERGTDHLSTDEARTRLRESRAKASAETAAKVVHLWTSNPDATMRDIASQVGVTAHHVGKVLRAGGLVADGRASQRVREQKSQVAKRRGAPPLPPDVAAELIREYAAGATLSTLAAKYNRGTQWVRRHLVAAGVSIRPPAHEVSRLPTKEPTR